VETSYGSKAEELSRAWQELCSKYLPVSAVDSIWRFSRGAATDEPLQGWKLHVSATVLNAGVALERVAPILRARNIQFKAPSSLSEINKINTGIYYGYSQIGKLITVYPRSADEAVNIAQQLYDTTRDISAPAVPFDERFGPDGCVYYRYGAFRPMEIDTPDGKRTHAIMNPSGEMVADVREADRPGPVWVANPFPIQNLPNPASVGETSPLKRYAAFRALTQRGRGGVYQALDLTRRNPRFCILKEGRSLGEVSWDGRDGAGRVRNEETVLRALLPAHLGVPAVYASFVVEDNQYLVTEFIAGESLQAFLTKRRRRMSAAQVLNFGVRIASLISRIHAAGWAWRDCKPSNIMITRKGVLRPIDFEGACPLDKPDPLPWGTEGFTPKWRPVVSSRASEDLYALGAILYLLLTGKLPGHKTPIPVAGLRPKAPRQLSDLIEELLAADPPQTEAGMIRARLSSLLSISAR